MNKPNKNVELRAASIERLLACAIDLFVRNGYRGTALEVIATRAGLTKGAIYFYFKTKEAIMLRLLDEVEAAVVNPVVQLMDKAGTSAAQKLVSFIHHQSLLGLTHPQHILLLILASIEFRGTDSEIEARVKTIYRRLNACVDRFIRQGQTEGSFRDDISSELLTAVVVAAHKGVLLEWYRRPGEHEGKTLTRAMSSSLLKGLIADHDNQAQLVNPS
jgi:AcrR family transcriptional regulator